MCWTSKFSCKKIYLCNIESWGVYSVCTWKQTWFLNQSSRVFYFEFFYKKRFKIWRTKLKLTPREPSRNNFNVKTKIKGNIKEGELEVVFKRKNRPALDCTPWKFPKCISRSILPISTNVNVTYQVPKFVTPQMPSWP